MKNVYEQMLDDSTDPIEEHITFGLLDHVDDADNGRAIYSARDDQPRFSIVEGIAAAHEGIDCVYYDIPGHGRVRTNNAEPAFPFRGLSVARFRTKNTLGRISVGLGVNELPTFFDIFHRSQMQLSQYADYPEFC